MASISTSGAPGWRSAAVEECLNGAGDIGSKPASVKLVRTAKVPPVSAAPAGRVPRTSTSALNGSGPGTALRSTGCSSISSPWSSRSAGGPRRIGSLASSICMMASRKPLRGSPSDDSQPRPARPGRPTFVGRRGKFAGGCVGAAGTPTDCLSRLRDLFRTRSHERTSAFHSPPPPAGGGRGRGCRRREPAQNWPVFLRRRC